MYLIKRIFQKSTEMNCLINTIEYQYPDRSIFGMELPTYLKCKITSSFSKCNTVDFPERLIPVIIFICGLSIKGVSCAM